MKQTGIEKVGRLATRLGDESAKAQHASINRKADELLVVGPGIEGGGVHVAPEYT
jgi:hypothetical protein